jgi:hypothetical protein
MNLKACNICGVEKPEDEFVWKNKIKGKRRSVCKPCIAARSKKWYRQNQERQKENAKNNRQRYRQNARNYVWQYLLSNPCTVCGESDPLVLEFHHTGNKETEVAHLMGRNASLDALIREFEKCQVVCSNCHRRITAREQGWYRCK